MATKGVLIFRGDTGNPRSHYSKTQIEGVSDDTALGTLATALAAYSDANMAKRSFVSNTIGTDVAPVADANVDYKGIAYFRDSSDLSVHSITIPAIKSSAVIVKDEGDRITDAAMTAIVAAIATATGKTLTPLYGVVIQKR
jgi:hypothetical protein